MTLNTPSTRKRGVRASRAKLYRALTRSGLRSQAELAARIADLEQLESEPRSLVNRVFREQPVEPGSLERVARALEVDAWTLYFNGCGEPPDQSAPEVEPESPPAVESATFARPWVQVAISAVGLALLALVLTNVAQNRPTAQETGPRSTPGLLKGRPTVAVLDFANDHQLGLTPRLRQKLDAEFSVVMGALAETLSERYGARDAAERLRVRWLIDGEHVQHGRWSRVHIWAEHGSVRNSVWTHTAATSGLSNSLDSVSETAFAHVRDHVLGDPQNNQSPLDPAAQDDYLIGRMYLDRASTELNVRRAQGRFEAAIRREPKFARAHAGLCLALLEEIWIQNEQWALAQSRRACAEAQALAPNDEVVHLAQAALLRRSGEIEAALQTVETALDGFPSDADLLNLAAVLHFHRFRQQQTPGDLERARAHAQASAKADPLFWRPLFTRAIIEYFADDIEAAIAASRAALKLEENASILTNLGSFELCVGDIQKARTRYERVRELAPEAHTGDEFLGLVHYFLGDFETSLKLRQRAIDALGDGSPEIHQMWGGLAESRLKTNDHQGALAAWMRAIEIVERDRLQGTAGLDDSASRLYYYSAVKQLQPEVVDAETTNEVRDELAQLMAADLSANAWVNIAKAWLQLEGRQNAKTALTRAVEACPGYAQLPDFSDLVTEPARLGKIQSD